MKFVAIHPGQTWARERLASWENEGGAVRSAPKAIRNQIAPASILAPAAALRGADNALTDANSLAILKISLLLLVPALGSIAIFWGAASTSGSQ